MKAIHEVFERYKQEYWRGSKVERSEVLDTVCETTNLHRKSAVRKFQSIFSRKKFESERRGRPVKYGADVTAALFDAWEVGARCCAENLHSQVAIYKDALKELGKWKHTDTATELLSHMSLGEMKRRIKGLVKKQGGGFVIHSFSMRLSRSRISAAVMSATGRSASGARPSPQGATGSFLPQRRSTPLMHIDA